MTAQNSKKNNYKKWLILINIPVQMGVIIFLFTYLGKWLDEKFVTKSSVFTIVLSISSVFIALYNVVRQVNDLNKEK